MSVIIYLQTRPGTEVVSDMSRRAGDATPPDATLSQGHFDNLYAQSADPWNLATAWYERRKYAITVASLPRERYRSAYEPGCSIGELTRLLAPRCDRLLAVDFSPAAVAQAQTVVRHLSHVRVERAAVPENLPDATYDLIVLSEILYYFAEDDLRKAIAGLVKRLEPDGDLVAVHHRASDRCYGYDGFNVHQALTQRAELVSMIHHEDEDFVLDVHRKSA
ncbi:MAG: SAM-dependent methyltransferase [Nocardioides sp.]